jgi:hypothetical protein
VAANVSDVVILPDRLHCEQTRVCGDGAYQVANGTDLPGGAPAGARLYTTPSYPHGSTSRCRSGRSFQRGGHVLDPAGGNKPIPPASWQCGGRRNGRQRHVDRADAATAEIVHSYTQEVLALGRRVNILMEF